MTNGTVDFDDPGGLVAADLGGHLRSAALAGAQARAVASMVDEGVLAPIEGVTPRAVVVVCGAGPAEAAAEFVEALSAGRLDVPLVRTTQLPPWVGALDVVVVCGFDAGDRVLAQAVSVAARRGASVAVAVPFEGPIAEAAAGRGIELAPRLHVPERFGFTGIAVALLAVLGVLGHTGDDDPRRDVAGFLFDLADHLDAEAVRGHPDRELDGNPAKRLAARMLGHRAVFTADTVPGLAIAGHAAAQALALGGQVAAAVGMAEIVLALPEFESGPVGGAVAAEPVDPLFHDPFLDGPPPQTPMRVFAVTAAPRSAQTAARLRAVGDVDLLVVDEDLPRIPADRGEAAPQREPSVRMEATELLGLAVRCDLAMVYRRLSGEA
ncbi:hypothetical protein P0W64_12885 [Tsukamurella sp. 8F]|uniref:hypothetical protein n=1 Tax=unclassified Tsukamurella TaxID=2633480 RepID=UPI0023B9A869|nr:MULTISPECIES: hypothetical protein [unclassified Tsukamurella]MDF0530375.1 hypothetical protein [Tsukamurella sp. 8J]MDF0587672.1 hypothetical protein [Tsukamurella sp. 8F]